jgi:hypothetical protein
MLKRESITQLSVGTILYHQISRNADGSPIRCKVNGKIKVWKSYPNDFEIPAKYGFKPEYFYITQKTKDEWCLSEEDALLYPLRKAGDWNEYFNKTGLRPEKFYCSHCKKEKDTIKDNIANITTGYAINKKNELNCYSCCAEIDKQYMVDNGKICLYLTKKKLNNCNWFSYVISNWPGSLFFKIIESKTSKHNWNLERTDAWFIGPDGHIWHGIHIGNNTQLIHCKRTKDMGI